MDSTKTEKPMKMRKKRVKHPFPEGAIHKILLRLPVKSLIRFACLSKGWQSVVLFDPKFAKDHFKLAKEQNTLTSNLLNSDLTAPQVDCLDLDESFLFNPGPVRRLNPPFEQRPVRLMGSCNGLILVSHGDDCKDLSVWNPSTGFLHKLPKPYFSFEGYGQHYKYGIGYVSATDDYKVVICYYTIFEHYDLESEFLVFSMRADSWKRIEDPYPEYLNLNEATEAVVSHEALHWLCLMLDGNQKIILAFDLESEEFRKLQLPSFNNQNNWTLLGAFVGGCLCVAGWADRTVEEYIELFVMKDYGVAESWTKLFKFRVYANILHDSPLWDLKPIVYTGSGTVLVMCYENGLIRTKMPTENMVGYSVYTSEEEMRVVTQYEETLLSLIEYQSPTQDRA